MFNLEELKIVPNLLAANREGRRLHKAYRREVSLSDSSSWIGIGQVIATEYKWLVLTVTTVGAFMAAVDENIVFVGLPSVLHELHASLVEGVWVIAGYALSTTILLVAFGRVSDLFGKVKLYILGFAMFTVASALCGLSQSGDQLVFFRLLQGIGAALLLVNSVVLVADAFPSYELGMALGLNFMAWNVGAIAGYTLGGFIVHGAMAPYGIIVILVFMVAMFVVHSRMSKLKPGPVRTPA